MSKWNGKVPSDGVRIEIFIYIYIYIRHINFLVGFCLTKINSSAESARFGSMFTERARRLASTRSFSLTASIITHNTNLYLMLITPLCILLVRLLRQKSMIGGIEDPVQHYISAKQHSNIKLWYYQSTPANHEDQIRRCFWNSGQEILSNEYCSLVCRSIAIMQTFYECLWK